MSYVDGYVIPIPRKKLGVYRRMAKMGRDAWLKHGALDYKECVGDDLKNAWGVSFSRLAKTRPGETVIFAFVVFKSKAHRDTVNRKVMNEMENADVPTEMPFDIKRMAYGGFKALVE